MEDKLLQNCWINDKGVTYETATHYVIHHMEGEPYNYRIIGEINAGIRFDDKSVKYVFEKGFGNMIWLYRGEDGVYYNKEDLCQLILTINSYNCKNDDSYWAAENKSHEFKI
jgi:hypothetical protein